MFGVQDTSRLDTLGLIRDSLGVWRDSLGFRLDSLGVWRDSLGRRRDSLQLARDTTGIKLIKDTTYVVYLDSTSRLRQFSPVRRDPVYTEFFPERTYPLFGARKVAGYRREATLDSSGTTIGFRETIGGEPVRIPVSMNLREYVAARTQQEFRRMLADEARKPKALVARNDLGELLSNITQIHIPIPPNPIFSIFGKPEIKLNISGAVDIKAGFRNVETDQTTISYLDQSRNEPDFSQDVQVNVNGTIGDKLQISADWNTQRTFEYENQLKIKYTGYEDEIVRSVEAGNVSLQTPSSFIGSSQALFGVKAQFQMGPLTLTTLASQKKGQIKEVAVSGGASEQTFEMRAYEYATNHFFVDTVYKQYYEPYYQNDPPTVVTGVQIVEEEVWVQRQGGVPLPNERLGIAYIELPALSQGNAYNDSWRDSVDVPGRIETGPFVKLDPSQYEMAGDGYLGVLSLNTSVGDQQIVAIAYRNADGVQYGELTRGSVADTTKSLVLLMVKPKNLLSNGKSYPIAWNKLLKNIYPIQGIGRNVKKAGFTLDIVRVVPGSEDQNSIFNEPLLRVFGLDQYNSDDTPAPNGDGQFDYRVGRTINQARAELIFPHLRPFDHGVKDYLDAKGTILHPDTSEYFYHEVYDTSRTFAEQSLRNRYVIRGKATGEASSRYSLGFNVVEGSVQVLLDGAAMVANVDYTVDYIIGEVVIKNARALVPGANLQIKYEQNDLFQLASKTLLGARGDLSLTKNLNFGFTVMNLNQQTLSDKVRLGEEPNNNTIFGIDGSTTFDLPFLTRALDALPVFQTREASQLKVSGEAAYMLPDPNTKKSPIPSDNGEGIAYIDDFEAARRTIPVGISYAGWTLASPPADLQYFPGVHDTVKAYSRGRMHWFNRLPTDVKLTDIYPRKQPGNAANDLATVLDFRYFPAQRGPYNYSMDIENTLTPNRNWGGLMKPLSVSAINLLKENINFIELWMRVDRAPPGAKMLIDLGSISEDVIPNRTLNSEDLVISSYPNGVLQEGEDVGIDEHSDVEERALHSALIARYPELAADPSGDNYAFTNATVGQAGEDFSRINGTEANKDGPSGRIPDTEDLNANGIVDLANSYYQYELSLDTNATTNERIVGGGNQRWFQFRIPIRDTVGAVGTPSQENIEYIRVSFINATDTIAVRIADFNLVGNQWQKAQASQADTTFEVTVVNVEDNPSYESPPGVIRERDRTRPEEEVYANEQSLTLLLKSLPVGESRQAVKFYTYRALDLFNYKTMKMFVHGDPKFQYVDENRYDAEFFFRFGLDSLNFYEYRAPIRPGWDLLNEVLIQFEELTAVKQGRDSINRISDPIPVTGGPPGSFYRVLGNPSLTRVVYLAVGVENPAGKGSGQPLVGEVWVNELRLTSVDDTPGWAYRFDGQLKLADIGSVSFNYARVDPNFHTLEQRFGSRQLSTNWGMSASFAADRLLNEEWAGTTMPISFSHTESMAKPRYLPNSDLLVEKAAEQTRAKIIRNGGTEEEAQAAAEQLVLDTESRRVTDTYAAPNFRINFPSNAWYIRDTFNKLNFGFSYTRSTERSPSVVSRVSWSWNARIAYAFTFPTDYYIQPFRDLFEGLWFLDEYKDIKIYFAPTNLTWSINAIRSRDRSLQRTVGAQEIISRNFSASRQFGFGWKLTEGGLANLSGDYNVSVESSLLNFELDRQRQQRPFSTILGDIFFGDRFINFGQDTRYAQRNTFNTRPNIPNIFNIKKYLDLTFGYSVDYSWQNTLTRGDLGKSAGWNSSINLSMNLRLKQLFDPLFETKPTVPGASTPRGRRGGGESASVPKDSTQTPDTTAREGGLSRLFGQLGNVARFLIKIPLLDYDNINVTFSQTNNTQNSGVVGRSGFTNFWGRVPFFQESVLEHGPSRLYQLGLISDPSGRLTNFGSRPKFPFFGWDVEPGLRAPGGILVNTFRQNNRLSFKTSRGLWEGARLDLNWNVGWAYNRSQNIQTDSVYGIPTVLNATTSGSVDRSFLTMPDVLFLGVFKTSLKEVGKRYGELKNDKSNTQSEEEKLNQAFIEGFEALPFLRKVFGEMTPRVNWSFRWDGLEKLPLFAGFVNRLSVDHAYNSNYTRQYQNRPGGGGERTDGQRVMYGFSPLIAANFTFKELWKGSFGANMRYNTTTSYDLATSSRNIVEALSREISVTASYSRRGFEIPFFGLSLNNDIDVSFSYSVTKNSRLTYDISKLDLNVTGTPLEGTTRTIMEPRIKYVLSLRVNASVYYRYTKIEPDDSGSRIPGSTTNEAGLDIHISIQ
ncbi:MAG: cell surface protein SprA [Bacteroidetes bacterium]|nr:cell surface protein SprA [Bacteroidota bacterium]